MEKGYNLTGATKAKRYNLNDLEKMPPGSFEHKLIKWINSIDPSHVTEFIEWLGERGILLNESVIAKMRRNPPNPKLWNSTLSSRSGKKSRKSRKSRKTRRSRK